jgi:hypothetical protein
MILPDEYVPPSQAATLRWGALATDVFAFAGLTARHAFNLAGNLIEL